MKIKAIKICLGILMFLAISCRNQDEIKILEPVTSIEKLDTIFIPKTLEDISFDSNSDLKDVHYVRLETTMKSLIGAIDKMFVTKDRIIIADVLVSKSILFFDRQGKFLTKTSAGKQPVNRFVSIRDVTFDYDNNIVSVFDDKKKSILNFDQNGKFLAKIAVKPFFLRFSYIGDALYACQTPLVNRGVNGMLNDYDLAITDKKGTVKYAAWDNSADQKILPDYDYNIKVPSSGSGLFTYYCPKFSSTVFQLETKPLKLYPRFYLEYLGKNNVIPNENMTISQFKTLKQNMYYFEGDVVSSGDVHFFHLSEKDVLTGVFYSTKSKKIIGGKIVSKLKINEPSKVEYYSYPISSTDEEFISVMDPASIVDKEVTSMNQDKKYNIKPLLREKHLEALMKQMKKDDNPVILFYKINI